jgi:hypothetical protein
MKSHISVGSRETRPQHDFTSWLRRAVNLPDSDEDVSDASDFEDPPNEPADIYSYIFQQELGSGWEDGPGGPAYVFTEQARNVPGQWPSVQEVSTFEEQVAPVQAVMPFHLRHQPENYPDPTPQPSTSQQFPQASTYRPFIQSLRGEVYTPELYSKTDAADQHHEAPDEAGEEWTEDTSNRKFEEFDIGDVDYKRPENVEEFGAGCVD